MSSRISDERNDLGITSNQKEHSELLFVFLARGHRQIKRSGDLVVDQEVRDMDLLQEMTTWYLLGYSSVYKRKSRSCS